MAGREGLTASLGLSTVFEDPISFELMTDAISTPCGHSFSDETIRDWLQSNNSCPLCSAELTADQLKPNYSLREAVEEYQRLVADLASGQGDQKLLQMFSEPEPGAAPSSAGTLNLTEWATMNRKVVDNEYRLLVEVKDAEHVPKSERRTMWCRIKFINQSHTSTYLKNQERLVFDQMFIFLLEKDPMKIQLPVHLEIWEASKGIFGSDAMVGQVSVPLSLVTERKDNRLLTWHTLLDANHKPLRTDARIRLRIQVFNLKYSAPADDKVEQDANVIVSRQSAARLARSNSWSSASMEQPQHGAPPPLPPLLPRALVQAARPAPPPASPQLQMLLDMGFDRQASIDALAANDDNPELAAAALIGD